VSRLRRLLNLQAASSWRDLKSPLGDATGTVLDVGAGAQPYRPLIDPVATYRAVDTVDARERFGYDMPGTAYFSGADWPVADRTIDLLLATETLEHIADLDAFLAQARRVLRGDGQLILTVPFSATVHSFVQRCIAGSRIQAVFAFGRQYSILDAGRKAASAEWNGATRPETLRLCIEQTIEDTRC